MSAFSDEMAAVGLELLTEFGEAVSFTRTTEGEYNPADGTVETGTDTIFTGYGLPVDYSNRDIDGTIIEQGDSRLYVNAVSVEPTTSDKVTVSGRVYRVINVSKYSINGANVLYELQIRV